MKFKTETQKTLIKAKEFGSTGFFIIILDIMSY